MKPKLIVFFLFAMLLSCKEVEHFPYKSFSIDGDWVNEHYYHGKKEKAYFTFEKDYCSYLRPEYTTSGYQLKKDTLEFGEDRVYKFTLFDTTNNSVSLKAIGLNEFWRQGFNSHYPDNILSLKKIVQKNDLEFKRIGFSSSPCNGTCPDMKLEIDSIGNVIISLGRYGGNYNEAGFYTGKLSSQQLEILFRKARNIEFKTKQSSYGGGYIDMQYFGLIFETNKGKYEISSANIIDEAPIEVLNLSYLLMELHKKIKLTKAPDSGFSKKFIFPNLQKEVFKAEEYFSKGWHKQTN